MKNPPRLPAFLRSAAQLTGLAAWQTGRLFRKTARTALDAVQDVLRAEVVQGNGELVREFVVGKALPVARTLLLERMAARLLLRLGLRGALASNVVGWILPLVIEQLLKAGRKSGLFEKVSQYATVQDTLQRLDELRAATWKRLAPDHGTGAELLADDTSLPPQLSA
ncbi:type I phosphoribosyltransferase [Hymenobacter rubripertinctus]|uniref:Uncharacterized protein n=1 Tax=Hymenobacter rubripertinctus TaxID=2029981 RepID=A0A418QTS6_9BACT|nr:hypothetical protein [Hymenobacter rubripertinctus]RIY08635.1 hypothetical protein D0T11_14065 [Hymenobacter rubripertinctus]